MATSAENIAQRILFARKKARMSREKVAQGLDMSSRTVERWEKGDTQPGEEEMELLCAVLGVSVGWLLTGEGEMLVGNLPRREYVTEKTPTHETSKSRIGTPGSGMYNPESVRIITQNTEEDMTYDPSLVVPMLLSAYAAVMNRDDLERARLFKETGKRFRVRLTVEEDDPRTSEEPPPSKG